MRQLHPHQYTNAFIRWFSARHTAGRKRCRRSRLVRFSPTAFHLILTLEMLRQHTPGHNIRLLVNNSDGSAEFFIREYITWVNECLHDNRENPLLITNKLDKEFTRQSKLTSRKFHFASMRSPNALRGCSYHLIGMFRCDLAPHPKGHAASNFEDECYTVFPMVSDTRNSVLICVGNAYNHRTTFAQLYAAHHYQNRPIGPWHTFDCDDSQSAFIEIRELLRDIREPLPPYTPPVEISLVAMTTRIERRQEPWFLAILHTALLPLPPPLP